MCNLCLRRPITFAPAVEAKRANSSRDSSVVQPMAGLSSATATRNALSSEDFVETVVFGIILSRYVKLLFRFKWSLGIVPASHAGQSLDQRRIRDGKG